MTPMLDATMATGATADVDHVLAAHITDGDTPIACRVINFACDYRSITSEAMRRTLIRRPEAAGERCRIGLRLARSGSDAAYVDGVTLELRAGEGEDVYGEFTVPVSHFNWIFHSLAIEQGVQDTDLQTYLSILHVDRSAKDAAQAMLENSDFAVTGVSVPELRFPRADEFLSQPPGPTRMLDDRGTWLRAVWKPKVLDTFLRAAADAGETGLERGWALSTQTHLTEEACRVVICDMVEMPGAHSRGSMLVKGSAYHAVRFDERVRDSFGGFAHLHPPAIEVDGKQQPLSPDVSGPDSTVIWRLDAAVSSMARAFVAPIAIFGATHDGFGETVKVHAYRRGILSPISVEVEEE